MPRRLGSYDPILGEDASSYYDKAVLIDMYVKNSESGFGGKGDFLSPMGYGIDDTMTVVVARRKWMSEVGDYEENSRPLEGDLIYFPLNKKIFIIDFVEHESIFYQVGALQVWELRCSLFQYSGEVFDTGIEEIDSLSGDLGLNIAGTGLLLEEAGNNDEGLSILDELNGLPILLEDYTFIGEEYGAMNDVFQEEGSNILDFTCIDPFANGEY